jgi:hypothetical protein
MGALIGLALVALVLWRSLVPAPRVPVVRRSSTNLVSSQALLRVLRARKR